MNIRDQDIRWENHMLDRYYDDYDANSEMEELLGKLVTERLDEAIQEKIQEAVIVGGTARVSYADGEIMVEIISCADPPLEFNSNGL